MGWIQEYDLEGALVCLIGIEVNFIKLWIIIRWLKSNIWYIRVI